MTEARQGELLWEPPSDVRTSSRMGRFLDRVQASRGLDLGTYAQALAWSVEDLPAFWTAVADEFAVAFHDPATAVLVGRTMPDVRWFPGATLNYAEQALRGRGDDPAIIARSQTRATIRLSFDEVRDQVARAVIGLRDLGVRRGDRVVAYLPNVPETVVAYLACASLGAVWSSCAPEFGTTAVVDRVRQIEPTVLLAVDGYRYGSREIDRATEVAAIRAALPSLRATVVLPYLRDEIDRTAIPEVVSWAQLLATGGELTIEPVPFDHPLHVLYSSGTTGAPKAIVQGHGGIVLEHCKMLGLHHDLGPGDRFTWFTTTGWMMWNYLVSGLLVGSTIVLFDGDPGHPDLSTLWRLADDERVALFGTSAPFLLACRKAGLSPVEHHDLSSLRSVGSTGAPLPPEGFGWVRDHVGSHVQVASVSGGSDLCTAFVGAAPLLPVHAGEISGRCLGADVQAFDAAGRPVIGQRGELVLTSPMPSMPVGFWGDRDGSRYRAAYFEDFPGVWRHGDWVEFTERGSCVITGRSDATLNRGGVRMGTSEFYSAVEGHDDVQDSLVVHLDATDQDDGHGGGRLLLFVRLADGVVLDEGRREALGALVRAQLSPRHVPDAIHQVRAIPRTISGKKMEVPVKRLLEGEPLDQVANPGSMQDPTALEDLRAFVG